MSSIVSVGSTVNNGNNKKKQPAESGELTRQIRIAAAFRPYVQGGFNNYYLPKYRSFADAEQRQEYSLGFRFGPIFDGDFQRIGPVYQGSSASNPFIADFEGAPGSVTPPIYSFGDSLDYTITDSTVYVKLINIPTGSANPGGIALTKIQNIIITFDSAPNIQSGTFSGPAVPTAQGTYLVNGWQYVFGGTPLISSFEGVTFSFNMVSTTPKITAIEVDLIV